MKFLSLSPLPIDIEFHLNQYCRLSPWKHTVDFHFHLRCRLPSPRLNVILLSSLTHLSRSPSSVDNQRLRNSQSKYNSSTAPSSSLLFWHFINLPWPMRMRIVITSVSSYSFSNINDDEENEIFFFFSSPSGHLGSNWSNHFVSCSLQVNRFEINLRILSLFPPLFHHEQHPSINLDVTTSGRMVDSQSVSRFGRDSLPTISDRRTTSTQSGKKWSSTSNEQPKSLLSNRKSQTNVSQ